MRGMRPINEDVVARRVAEVPQVSKQGVEGVTAAIQSMEEGVVAKQVPKVMQSPASAFVEVVIDKSLKVQASGDISSGSIKDGFGALKAECIESISDNRDIFVSSHNGFVMAVYHAFNRHVPLCFGPDDLWTLIVQGVSKHIELNAEELRSKFVDFEGKKVLRIHRDHFVLGSPTNDWAGCFQEWSQMVAKNIGQENTTNLVPTFSTTGDLEKALHELALMDCMKSYFDFRCRTCCGISKVKLLGTHEDWLLLLEKVEGLRQYQLDWWVDALVPILQKIVKTYTGEEVDKIFWYTIYKQWSTHGSGAATYVNGWITTFFPYLRQRRRQFSNLQELREDASKQSANTELNPFRRGQRTTSMNRPLEGTLEEEDVPNGVSSTPFIWEYHGAEIPMTIYGGFAGCEMDGEYIRPVLAWAVGKDRAEVYKNLVSKHGQVAEWTQDALCEYFYQTRSTVGQQASGWIQKTNITGKQLIDFQGFYKLMNDQELPFDRRQFIGEVQDLRSLSSAR